jgi:hemolysin activation/secretion protein
LRGNKGIMRGFNVRIGHACGIILIVSCCGSPALAEPSVAPKAAAPAPAPAPETFFIQAFDVSGVTVLSAAEIEALVYPHAGPDRTQADVEAARKAIADAYAAKGYGAALVDIPVQQTETFAAGIIQIAVNEAPVGQVRVVGAKYHSLWVAREAIPALVEGQPVNLKTLQTQVSAANRFPDRAIDPQFKAGRVAGEIDVDLKMTDERPLHASAQVDNDFSPNTKPLRLTANARYTNLFQTGQAATFTFVVAPQNVRDTEVFAGSYTIPVLGTPWTFSLSGYHSNSNVASLGGSAVLGNGFQVGARLLYRLPAADTSQSISFGLDFKDFKQKILVSGALASSAPVRYVPAEIQYALAGASEHSSYDFSIGTTAGLRIMHQVVCVEESGVCVPADAFQNREQFSYENFVRVNASADYTYAFANDVIAAARLTGQFADGHLVTNEQFAAGGLQTVRGYYSSEAVGDTGIEPSLELRWPSLASKFGPWLSELRFYSFADGALLHVDSALTGQHANYHLVGLGSGLRMRLFGKVSGDLLAALPLTNGPVTVRRRARFNFMLKGDF